MALDCTDIFCGANGFPAGPAAAGNSGGQQMQAITPSPAPSPQWLSTSTGQTVS